jgi:hypothetical protein
MEYRRHPENVLNHLLSIIFIYPMIAPLIILHFFLEIYHYIGFRLYGLPLVERAKYIRIDRHKLPYLGPVAKLNCIYCGYANGLLAYAARIAGDTEAYWCGIKHEAGNGYIEPAHHKYFLKYGDEVAYRQIGTRPTLGLRGEEEKVCKLSKEKT